MGPSLMVCSAFEEALHLTPNRDTACTSGPVCDRQQCVPEAHRVADRIVLPPLLYTEIPIGHPSRNSRPSDDGLGVV